MRPTKSLKLWKRLLIAALGLHALAFTVPQKDDLVELSSFLNARSEAKFRKSDRNVLATYQPGTKAEVQETKRFQSGNYGICIKVLSASAQNKGCSWVYYNGQNPNMKLYAVSGKPAEKEALLAQWDPNRMRGVETNQVERATAAVTTKIITAIVLPLAHAAGNIDSKALLESSIENFSNLNNPQSSIAPVVECTNCVTDNLAYPSCTEANDYLQDTLNSLFIDPELAAVLQSPVNQIIRTSCVQRSLDAFPNNSSFKTCDAGKSEPNRKVGKACTSQSYVNVTTKSFNAVADCMADFASGNESTKKETALEIFSLMAHESGLHANAVSPTGAGGVGQLTQDAIKDVNANLRPIINHLSRSTNPLCKQTMVNLLKTPMDGRKKKSCERIELDKENPLKNMLYSFAFQGINRTYFQTKIFDSRTFEKVISWQLPSLERERLMASITAWSHNTGRGGMAIPLRAQLTNYLRKDKKVSTAADVDEFLKTMETSMTKYSFYNEQLESAATPLSKKPKIRARIAETANYFKHIQSRVSSITKEPRSCLVN